MKIDRRSFIVTSGAAAGIALFPMPAVAEQPAVFNVLIFDGDNHSRVLKGFRMPLESGFENALGAWWDDYLLFLKRFTDEFEIDPHVREWWAVYSCEWAFWGGARDTQEVLVTKIRIGKRCPITDKFKPCATVGDGTPIHPLVRKLPKYSVFEPIDL